jgi:hypothetical protein
MLGEGFDEIIKKCVYGSLRMVRPRTYLDGMETHHPKHRYDNISDPQAHFAAVSPLTLPRGTNAQGTCNRSWKTKRLTRRQTIFNWCLFFAELVEAKQFNSLPIWHLARGQ